MPELPEVETIKLQLQKHILNKTIKDVHIIDSRLIKGISPRRFAAQVKEKRIRDVFRRGKVLIIKLDEGLFLTFHLRISGWIMVSAQEEKCARVVFILADKKRMTFCDARALGEIRLAGDWRALPFIQSMGPEPLTLNVEEFIQLCAQRKAKIKPLLMTQTFLAGIGNIYAQEALFCAGIHPERSAYSLTKRELGKLHQCLITVLRCAIEKKGSSISTFRHTDGENGDFASCFKVYQRKDQECSRCQAAIQREIIGGRGTYFCPQCQK